MTSPLDRIVDLSAWMKAAGLDELELAGPDGHVRLTRHPAAETAGAAGGAARPEAAPEPAPHEVIASPGIGHVLHAHPLRAEPLVAPDEAVLAGQPLALLRVGHVLTAVPAPRDGIVAALLAPDGALVGYGDPLVALWPAG